MMSSPLTSWINFSIAEAILLFVVLLLALLANRVLRRLTNALIQPAGSQARGAQAREQQTRALAENIYRAASALVWSIALLTVLAQLGVNVMPAVVVVAAVILAVGIGARNLVRDVIAGFEIVFEDQFAVGETVQMAQAGGKVEQIALRRTVLRDARGALVTVGNGEIRTVGNLSRDWSQAFVDISVGAGEPIERTVLALEAASATMRSDAAWSQTIVDGPRVLGVQAYGRSGPTLRIQVRTAPLRQEEVARELRRRIQIEFQRQNIGISSAQDFERPSVVQVPGDDKD